MLWFNTFQFNSFTVVLHHGKLVLQSARHSCGLGIECLMNLHENDRAQSFLVVIQYTNIWCFFVGKGVECY